MTGKRRFVGRAPGRLDLMGGLGAYTGGLVVETTTREAVWVTVELREDRQVYIFSPQMEERGAQGWAQFALDDLDDDVRVRHLVDASPGTGWAAHVLGGLFLLKEWFPDRFTGGANVYIKSELPFDKSAGAAAAVEVAAMKTAAHAYGIELAGVELAKACQWVGNIIAQSAGGVVGPIASVLGEEGRLLPVLCQDCVPRPPVQLPAGLRLWGVCVGGPAAGGIESDAARVAAFLAYKLVCACEGVLAQCDEAGRWTDPRWNGYLSNVTPSLFRSNYEQRLPEALTGAEYPSAEVNPDLTYRVRACARFVVEENQRARMLVELARAAAGFEEMGELMYQSHYGYTECGLGTEAADQLVSLVCEEGAASGLYGAKITGGGGAGVVAVMGSLDAEAALRRVVERFALQLGEMPYVFEGSSMGADRVGVLTLDP